MPPTIIKSGPALGIRLDDQKGTSFAPGDTIVGHVYREARAISPRACVTISLHGRSKTKKVESSGQSQSTYRGRSNLLTGQEGEVKLYDGPLHVEVGGAGANWPFALPVPRTFDFQKSIGGASRGQSFAPPGGSAAPVQQPLPSSFGVGSGGFSTSMVAFVEYWLVAKVMMEGHGTCDIQEAILPVRIWAVSPGPPIVNFKPKPWRRPASVSSQRLVPGMENAKLTFTQKAQKFFGSSKVPNFAFNIEVQAPSVIQLANPNPIPFLLRVKPIRDQTSEIVRDASPKVKLEQLNLYLKADTVVLCPGTFSAHHGHAAQRTDLGVATSISALGKTIYLPNASGERPLNVGKLIGLRVGRLAFPSFLTANISHAHRLKWEIHLKIADEDVKTVGELNVTVLAAHNDRPASTTSPSSPSGPEDAASSWIRPPEGEPPPPFTEDKKS